jgi:hypothetical protein
LDSNVLILAYTLLKIKRKLAEEYKVLVVDKAAEVVFGINGKRLGYENIYMEEAILLT